MLNYIPAIFKEDVYLLGVVKSSKSKDVLLYVSTLNIYTPMVYIVRLSKAKKHILDICASNVLWRDLEIDMSTVKKYSGVIPQMLAKVTDNTKEARSNPLLVAFRKTKGLKPNQTRLGILQEMLRLQHLRDLHAGGVAGNRQYTVSNSTHIKRVIGDYHAELNMTFGTLLPIPKDIRDDPENDEVMGRILELFLHAGDKLHFLMRNRHPLDVEVETKDINYTFMKSSSSMPIFQYLMNPFISMKI